MLASLNASADTWLLLGITVALGATLIWAFWEMEQRLPAPSRPLRKTGAGRR